MKTVITSHRLEPDTIRGEALQVVYTFSSFDKQQIDDMEDWVNKQKDGAFAVVINDEDDLK